MSLSYVGGKAAAISVNGATISLTDLTGGISSSPSEGDIVIVCYGVGSGVDKDLSISSSGYTEIVELYSNDARDSNLSVNWKIMGSTPDTSFSTAAIASGSTSSGTIAIHVWRGVDQITPFDVTHTTSTSINGGLANPPSINPTTTGAVVVSVGHGATPTTGAVYTSSDLSNFLSVKSDNSTASQIGIGNILWSGSGAVDPAVFGGGTNTTDDSWCAVSIALRPSISNTIYKGANWSLRYLGTQTESQLYLGSGDLFP